MPIRVWTHLCDYATVDVNGKASILGEFDRIFSQAVPANHPFFFVISKWNGMINESFSHQVIITSPTRQEIAVGSENRVVLRDTNNGGSNHITVDGFLMTNFPEYGEYAIEILLNGNPVHILPLHLVKSPNNIIR